jgi:hypothetical protein
MSKSNLSSNEICKRLIDESHHHATIPDTMRYSAHFEYKDLVQRLLRVKAEIEQSLEKNTIKKPEIKLELSQLDKAEKSRLKGKKKTIKNAMSDRVVKKKKKEFLLPLIKTPTNNQNVKEISLSNSAKALKKLKFGLNLKLKPLKHRRALFVN